MPSSIWCRTFSERTSAVVALVAPPLAWAASFQANYVLAGRACGAGFGAYLHLSTLIGLVVTGVSIALATRVSRRNRSVRIAALAMGIFFAIATAALELANVMVPRCG